MDDGVWNYGYDCENNLVSVVPADPTNGAVRVLNAYDHLNRRIRKTVQRREEGGWVDDSSTVFVYDGWNLLLETTERADGGTDVREYFWGPDLSGTEQGAGGVGGLLAVSANGAFHFPCYDHNGNVTCYVSESGAIAASYLYDAFGNMVGQSGAMAALFRHRFSTKYLDVETGHYYYGRRFYIPVLGRWLNRDPIEERGGENLYAFCRNGPVSLYDKDGCAYVAYRRLDNFFNKLTGVVWSPEKEANNRVWAHEHIFFEDGKSPADIGYFDDGLHSDNVGKVKWIRARSGLKDACLRKAVNMVKPLPYSLLGDKSKNILQYNCQDWVEDVLNMYDALLSGRTYYPKSTKFIGGR